MTYALFHPNVPKSRRGLRLYATRLSLLRALIERPYMLHEITDEPSEEARKRLEHEFELAEQQMVKHGY